MSAGSLKEKLHDIETHRNSWSKIVDEAAAFCTSHDSIYEMRAASIEIERRSDDFSHILRNSDSDEEILEAADQFLTLAPKIKKAMAIHLAVLSRSAEVDDPEVSYIHHEDDALNYLISQRKSLEPEELSL